MQDPSRRGKLPPARQDDGMNDSCIEGASHTFDKRIKSGNGDECRSLSRRLLQYGLSFLFIATTMFALVVGVLSVIIDDEFINRQLSELVAKHTGARVSIESSRFVVWRGLTLHNVSFFPPLDETAAEFHSSPAFTAEKVSIKYRLWELLLLRLTLVEAKVYAPKLFIQSGGQWDNLSGMAAYRNLYYAKPSEDSVADAAMRLPDQIPIEPSYLVSPLRISLNSIGFESLDVQFKSFDERNRLVASFEGESFDASINLDWFLRKSAIRMSLSSGRSDSRLTFRRMLEDGNWLDITSDLRFEHDVAITNLFAVEQKTSVFIEHLKLDEADYHDLHLHNQVSFKLASDLSAVRALNLQLDMASILTATLDGEIDFIDGKPSHLGLDLTAQLQLNLENASRLVETLFPSATLEGTVRSGPIVIAGEYLAEESLPNIIAALYLEGIVFNLPGTFEMKPSSGKVEVSFKQEVNGAYLTEALFSYDAPYVEKVDKDSGASSGAEDLSARVSATFQYPTMKVFKLQASLDALKLFSRLKGTPTVNAPFHFQLTGETSANFNDAIATAQLEIAPLATAEVTVKCEGLCNAAQMNASLELPNLDELLTFARPLMVPHLDVTYIPTELAGRWRGDISVSTVDLAENLVGLTDLMALKGVEFDVHSDVRALSLELPYLDLAIDDFAMALKVTGNAKSQMLTVDSNLKELSLTARPFNDSFDRVTFKDLHHKTSFEHFAPSGSFPARNLSQHSESTLSSETLLGAFQSFGDVALDLQANELKLKAGQANFQDLTIKELKLSVPSLGAQLGFDTRLEINSDWTSAALDANLEAEVHHDFDLGLLNVLQTSGRMDTSVKVSSPDLQEFVAQGAVLFDRFTLKARNQAEPESDSGQDHWLFRIEEISGRIPLHQKVRFDLLGSLKANATPPSINEVSQRNVGVDNGEVSDEALDKGVPSWDEDFARVAEQYFDRVDDRVAVNSQRLMVIDYPNVRGFFPELYPLTIKLLSVGDFNLSEIEVDIGLRQNWFSINQFGFRFLDGKVHGDFQLAFDPLPRTVQLSVHYNDLNTRRLLDNIKQIPEKTRRILAQDAMLSGVFNLNYDLKTSDMYGGAELTSIGREQLRMILFYLDPDGQNSSITDIKRALALGDVQGVSLPIRDGQIDLDVDVRFLGTPIPTPKLRRFPVGQIIDNLTREFGGSVKESSESI